ncbi:LacI family transcriptional regulator [Frankia sp. Mgl5]|uniref:LacI family DNA-binding transcriptional regulator n=1 Tax=Frankia sp. Mgl5 TaxID=2933793 RepID=UPI00200F9021|nr:LacI family DNA-binding transcriptional regulator [Frankia sp. Mgl5]MCK9931793.1 LacI family transcriptional regulator [Frankia sp. Mgl5]
MAGTDVPSVKDVAAHAGVSLGTVSNVLNRPELVARPTRERVLASIATLGFVRNESARQLRAGGSRLLAYVVPDTANPVFADVGAGVQEVADRAELAVFLCNSGEESRRQATYLSLLEQQRVEGVLLTPVGEVDEPLASLARRGTPVVLVDRAGGPGICSVTVDDVAGGELAVSHLLDSGHTRIAFVGGPGQWRVADRLAGARRGLLHAGADPDSLLRVDTRGADVAAGRRAGERLAGLSGSGRPTAVLCANDMVALGLLQQVTRLGLRVPDDLAVAGYEDIELAAVAAVPLTSVARPRQLLGRTAAELLLAETRDRAGHEHTQVVLAPELVVRASTGRRPADVVA